MNTLRNFHLNRLVYTLFIGTLVAAPALLPVNAKDTDIYLMSPSTTKDDQPNVMIILDNSGSMSEIVDNTPPEYDPSINYCTDDLDALYAGTPNAGKPSPCASSDRTYWAFPSGFSSSATPPAASSSQWFLSTRNKCMNSLDPLSALATSGMYAGTRIAAWSSGSGNGWKTLNGRNDTNITYVDCEADGTKNGLTTGDNQQLQCSGSSPCSNTSAYNASGAAGPFSWSGFNPTSGGKSVSRPTLYSANYINYVNNAQLLSNKSRLDVSKQAVRSLIDTYKTVRFGLMVFNANNSSPDGGRVLARIDNMDNTRRNAMKNIVNSLTPATNTPLAETMWEAYRYYGGLSVTYGNPSPVQTPHQDSCAQNTSKSACDSGGFYDAIAAGNSAYNSGTYISPFKYGCQKAFIIYVTDGDPTNDTAANAKIAGLTGKSCDGTSCLDDLSEYMSKNDVYSGVPDKQTVTTYTIGLGSGISASGQALLKSTAERSGGKNYTALNGGELNVALQAVLNETLDHETSFTAPSLSVNAFNRLYNRDDIYFALFSPNSSQAWDGNLKKFRLCNGTETPSCTFGKIIDKVGAAAIDESIDPATNRPVNKIKDSAKSYWNDIEDGATVTLGGAGAKITDNAKVPRTVYTYRGSYAIASISATPAVKIDETDHSASSFRTAAVANPTILGLPAAASAAQVDQLIKWMRGQDAYDEDRDCPNGTDLLDPANASNACITESRPWNFADPLHSRPVAFTFGSELSGSNPDPTKPIMKLFIGTNDGMVRMINNDSGMEEWAFIPSEMLSSQYALSQNGTGEHIVGIDNSPAFLTIDLNNNGIIEPAVSGGDKVYMYISMRRGGRNLYAFDVTPATAMTAQTNTVTPKLLWAINGGTGDFAQLGETWSRPVVARIRAQCSPVSVCDDHNPATNDSGSRMALILGGGYDANQDGAIQPGTDTMGNAIYIIDPFTGARIWWASSAAGASLPLTKMKYSIPSDITAIDTNGDRSVDRLYVGDTGGQLWRIDLGDQIGASGDGGSKGYVLADIGCDSGATERLHDTSGNCPASTTNQGRRKFFYPPDVAQIKDSTYSSSENYDLVTIGSGDREDPLDLLTTNPAPADYPVHNRIYAFRDYNYQSGVPGTIPTTPISEYSMYDASANLLGTLTGTARQTEINTKVKNSNGWFIDLVEPSSVKLINGLTSKWVGEKALAKTIVFDGVLYATTFVPANQDTVTAACTPNEGQARAYSINFLTGEPAFDKNGNNASDVSDRYTDIGGGIPSEVVIVIRDGGVTGLVGTSGGASGVNVGNNNQRYKTYWYEK